MYGDDCLSRANIFLWHKRFLEGRERLEDDNCEGRSISAMLIKFFDSKGIIHKEFVPTGQTITGAYTEKLFISICTIVFLNLGRNVSLRIFVSKNTKLCNNDMKL